MAFLSQSTTKSLLLVILAVYCPVSCQADEDWKNFDHYSTGGDAITSLDLDHLTGHVYLCNETTICHLNQHLQEQECASTDVPCLFLKVEQHHRYLFVGGTTSHVRSLRNVDSVVQVLDNPLSVFSECNGTHGLPCYTLVLGSDKDDKSVFFIGSSHGVNMNVDVATPENTTNPFISSRKITLNEVDQGDVVMKFAASNFDALSSRMSREKFKKMMSNNMNTNGTKVGYSALYVADKYQANLDILHVYSFRHKEFIYFVTNQRFNGSAFKVYLTRICQSDPLFSSYISVELKYVSYSFAQMAYYYSAANEKLPWLYVVFKKQDVSKNTTNLNHQVAAAFSLSDIDEVLDKTEKGCFGLNRYDDDKDRRHHGYGTISCQEYRLEHWLYRPVKVDEHRRSLGSGRYETRVTCQSTRRQQSRCDHPDNFGIRVKDPLSPHKVHHLSGFEATSLFVMGFQNESEVVDLLYIGTASGHLSLVLVNQNVSNSNRYLDTLVMGEESVGREMAVNREQTSLYLATGGKVVKVPLTACDIHTDCGTCIASQGPTNCAWCDDKCRAASQCERLPRQGKVCRPLIESVSPTSGPTTGGTKLTIRGANFGAVLPLHRRSPMDLATGTVKVGDKPCDILERAPHRIICLTSPGQASLLHDVMVEITDQSQFSIAADISGTGVASNWGFQYKAVSLSLALAKSISPKIGIFSGGTALTIHGQNLDVGNETSVFVGDRQCPIVQRRPEAIICTTPPWKVNYSQHFLPEMHELVHLRVTVEVDTLHLEAIDQFVYVVNPVIEEFQPTASFASGGVPVKVKGRYLNVIQNPMMHVHVVGSTQNATVKCQASGDGSSMTCLSPPIDIATEADTLQFSGRHLKSLGLLTNVWFELDNSDTARYRPVMSDQSTLTYYLDPSFQDLGIHTFYMNETKLVLHGRNLQSLQLQEKGAIKVMLGHGRCEVTRIRSSSLVCTPRHNLDNFDYASDLLDIKVGVGNLLFEPGKLRLREYGKECTCACACG